MNDIILVETNPLYNKLFHFGLEKVAKAIELPHRPLFSGNPAYKVNSVRTSAGVSLTVTFDADIKVLDGEVQNVVFTVVYQSWRNLMLLQNYEINLE